MSERSTTRWGRVRFGRRRAPAAAVAVLAVAVLAACLGLLGVAVRPTEDAAVAFGVVLFASLSVPCAALVWAVVVDRATLAGAPRDPEHSVENDWFSRAASGAFTDTLTAVGVALAVLAIGRLSVDAVFALAGVVVLAAVSFVVRYAWAAQRG